MLHNGISGVSSLHFGYPEKHRRVGHGAIDGHPRRLSGGRLPLRRRGKFNPTFGAFGPYFVAEKLESRRFSGDTPL
jgi:hypothetical protein